MCIFVKRPIQHLSECIGSNTEIALRLQTKPKSADVPKYQLSLSAVSMVSLFFKYNFINRLAVHSSVERELVLSNAQRFENLFQQDLTGMYGM